MTQTIVGIILVIFGITNIYLGISSNKIKEATPVVKSLNLGVPKVMIVDKNKIRWEYENGKGFEITYTEIK